MKFVGTWRPAYTEAVEVSGTLEQGDDGTFTLQTYAGLTNVEGGADHEDILGIANGREITIRNARLWQYEGGGAGSDPEAMRRSMREQYRSTLVAIGTHELTKASFGSMSITSEFLDAWIDSELWTYKIIDHRVDIPDLPIGPTAAFAGGSLHLGTGTHIETGQRKRWSITRNTMLNVSRTETASAQTWVDDVQHFDSLLDAVFGRPTAAASVGLTPADSPHRVCRGEVRVAGTFAEPKYADPSRWLSDRSALFPFAEGGGLAALAKWFDLAAGYRHIAGRVTSHYRSEGRFLEDRALTAFASGEAIDRLETGHAWSKARTRWSRLVASVPEFSDVISEMPVETWLDALVTDRDDLAHALSLGADPQQAARVRAVMDSAHLLSVLSLFRIAGMTEALAAAPASATWAGARRAFGHWMRAAGMLG